MKKKILPLILILSLMIAVFTVSALASEDSYIEWTLSKDGETLVGNGKTYTRVEIPLGYALENKLFRYYNYVMYDNRPYNVIGRDGDDEIVYLDLGDFLYAYVTEQGRTELTAFLNGTHTSSRLYSESESMIADIKDSFIAELDALTTPAVSLNVTSLRIVPRYEIWRFNSDDNLKYVYGAIYTVGNTSYYVNYMELPNSSFDADGNFSYLRGSVEMQPLTEELVQQFSETKDTMSYYSIDYDTEYDYNYPSTAADVLEDVAFALLILIIVSLGIILPLIPILFSLLYLFKWKTSHPVLAYIVLLAAVIWAILGVIILIIVV